MPCAFRCGPGSSLEARGAHPSARRPRDERASFRARRSSGPNAPISRTYRAHDERGLACIEVGPAEQELSVDGLCRPTADVVDGVGDRVTPGGPDDCSAGDRQDRADLGSVTELGDLMRSLRGEPRRDQGDDRNETGETSCEEQCRSLVGGRANRSLLPRLGQQPGRDRQSAPHSP